MNRFDEQYIFKHATVEDCDMIMGFIRDEWPKKNHILAENKDFFLYEFQNGQLLNFAVAIRRETGRIDGMMGYLRSSNTKETLDIWTCMWLTRRKGSIPFLGMEVMNRMKDMLHYRILCGIGTNPKTALPLAINKANHFAFMMKHFYRLSDYGDYKIAKIEIPIIPSRPDVRQFTLKPVNTINEIRACVESVGKLSIPLKNTWYINKRFFCHPIYKYLIWAIIVSGEEKGVLIGREININGRKILRIVEFMGSQELVGGLYDAFGSLIDVNHYEYIDFYIFGIDDIHLENAGFTLRTAQDPNIIPNYFEPFVQENVDIYGTSEVPNVRMCKADADQDRPNIIDGEEVAAN